MCYVYILKCKDNTFYTGYTTDLVHRLKMHQSGRGAKYTKGRLPVAMVYSEQKPTKGDALRREAEIKKLKKSEKQALIDKYIGEAVF